MTGLRSLTHREREQLFERRIQPDLLAGAAASGSPAAMIVAGQPGAGVPSVAAVLRRDLSKITGPVVQLSEARLRAYHPAWRFGAVPNALQAGAIQRDVSYWFERIIQEARGQRFHLLVEDEQRDPRSVHKLAAALRKDSYVVQAVFVATNRDESTLFAMAQFDLARRRGLPPRFVSAQEHDVALGNVRLAMGLVEDRRTVDGLRVIDRNASQFYENRLVDGEWIRAPRAQVSLDAVRDRPRTPKELVTLAMRWETLARRLANDPSVTRDVASQMLAWRTEAATRCEAAPASAQLLHWAREGAAFRVMDRFEFVREFPHHERAVKSLGAAVIEAEKYDAAESARFLASARENIAQRIERGDMARIAARGKTHEPPTR